MQWLYVFDNGIIELIKNAALHILRLSDHQILHIFDIWRLIHIQQKLYEDYYKDFGDFKGDEYTKQYKFDELSHLEVHIASRYKALKKKRLDTTPLLSSNEPDLFHGNTRVWYTITAQGSISSQRSQFRRVQREC